MAKRDIIVIGASAGGVEALKTVISGLPAALPATVLVVLHIPASSPSRLSAILARAGKLTVAQPRVDARLQPGWLYVAPPDHHLTLRGDLAHLSRGPRVNGFRPAVDPLFQTAAREAGPRVIGVVLSGGLDDGTGGMASIQRGGGATVVQDPSDALHSAMPRSVLEQMTVDRVLPAARIARALVELAGQTVPDRSSSSRTSPAHEAEDSETERIAPGDQLRPGSGYTCPECHGALWQTGAEGSRFRCRVGHEYTPEGLFCAQSAALESSIWAAYRALGESASLAHRLARRARGQGLFHLAERYERRRADARERAEQVRHMLENRRIDAQLDGDDVEAAEDAAPRREQA